ncbi:hypothetical protein GCM10023321_73720 [Pseudonocardia eucalypti]|uniref:Right handed beta helix domain-containing protein n=1 Tax=Pseudonocardia eucalypti TaxID=648755 RepID=A0ABP9R8W3_9PSEU
MVLAGCAEEPVVRPPGAAADLPAIAPGPPGNPGVGAPTPQANCTKSASDAAGMAQAVGGATPGERICVTGNMGAERLTVRSSGSPDRLITILGGGKATVAGITVEADNVIVDGFTVQQPSAPGASLTGTNVMLRNTAIRSPRGGDGDGIRFWGDQIRILHNTISDTVGQDQRHADCMQTFATDEQHPASTDVLIDGNRCEKIDNICLIAEGPASEAGDGSGQGKSRHIVFSNNFCENRAGQALFVDDVSDMQVVGNEIVGGVDKAFAFQNGSTGAKVSGNRLAQGIDYEVGMDDSSRQGYQGPEPGGGP